MTTQTFQVMANVTATLVVQSGSGPHLVWNQDLVNTLYIGDTNAIKPNDTSVIAVGPNTSVSVTGQYDVYATTVSTTPISIAVLQGGMSSFLGITESGGAFIGTSFRFYSGPPSLGDLVASIAAIQSTDPVGNTVRDGFTVYDITSNAYINIRPGNPPTIDLSTGKAFEFLPGLVRSQTFNNIDGSITLASSIQSPTVDGGNGSSSLFAFSDSNTGSLVTGILLQSINDPGTVGIKFKVEPTIVKLEDIANAIWYSITPPSGASPFMQSIMNLSTNGQLELDSSLTGNTDVAAILQLQSKLLTGGVPTVSIPGNTILVSTGGTAVNPTEISTDSWQPVSGFVNGWSAGGTGNSRYAKMPIGASNGNMVHMELNLVPGTLTDSTVMFTVPASYRPATNQNLVAATKGSTAAGTNDPFIQVKTDGSVICNSFPSTTTSVRVNGMYPLN